MLRAFLIDDETDSIEVMMSLLTSYFRDEVTVVGTATSAQEAFETVPQIKPDVIFLDIQMPGENGFAFLKKMTVIDFEVIFVTSHDEFALKAIKFSALDYLLKPVIINDLKQAIDKAKRVVDQKVFRHSQVLNLIANIESNEDSQKIAVHYGDEVRFLKLIDIIYFEAHGRYTTIYPISGEKYIVANHLKILEETLEESALFVRVNKSCLVNIEYITAYSKKEPYYLRINNGKEFDISRRKRQEVMDKLKERKI